MNSAYNKKSGLTENELRKFGLVIGAVTAFLFGLLLPWIFERSFPLWPWIVLAILWVLALLLPRSLSPIYQGWMKIGYLLGWINTRIILGILFYLLFFPIAVIMRGLGKDPMKRKKDLAVTSYRVAHVKPEKNHVERPY